MPNFKLDVDAKGNFHKEFKFKLVPPDLVGPDSAHTNVALKLIQPKGAHIKVLTLRINKTTRNTPVAAGTRVSVGPFPMLVGDNAISFEGHSDQLANPHEFEVIPQLLK